MNMSMKVLHKDIDQGRFQPIYLLYGPDEFLKERAVQKIVQRMVTPELREFNLDVLYGDETDAATIIDRTASLPMMAERRVVLVRNVDDLSIEERRKILEYSAAPEKRRHLDRLEKDIAGKEKELQDREKAAGRTRRSDGGRGDGVEPGDTAGRPGDPLAERDALLAEKRKALRGLAFVFPHACLLLTAAGGNTVKLFHHRVTGKKNTGGKRSGSRRNGRTAPRRARGTDKRDPALEPWLNTFADRTVTGVSFRAPSEGEIPARVRQLARDRGKSIAPRAVELLVKAVGNDLLAVNNELAKLSIFVADRAEIGPRDVEMVVGELKTRSIWDLCDAVLSGRAAGAFSLLGRLLETGLAVPQLTGALRWRLSQLVSGRGGGRTGGPPGGLGECLEEAYGLLYETEFSVNTGRRSSPMAMTLLIDRLCRLFASAGT